MILKHARRKAGTRDRLVGLLAYLGGQGRDEEHTNQRLVAAWDESLLDVALGDPGEQRLLADLMEAPARAREMARPSGGFVYHAPISLHAEDGQLSDEQWAYVARTAIAKLGFEECRWVAVHHGMAKSEQGPRDHLHLVIHRARDNGTVASTWNDYRTLAELRAELEDDPTLGLRVKTQRQGGGRDGWSRGERDRAERAERSETDREYLERHVRAAAGAGKTESDWIQTMRGSGLLVRPRYGTGGRSEVVGYSVAMPPESGESPSWFGGGKLAKDLTLTAIRRRWDGHDPAAALADWARAAAGEHATRQPRRRLPSSAWSQAQEALGQFQAQLTATPLSDTLSWRHAARETAEAVAALSMQAPSAERHTLARAATGLARAAEVGHGQPRGGRSPGGGWMRTACEILSSASTKHGGTAAVAEVMLQLSKLSTAIAHARRAEADAAAARMAADAATELAGLGRQLHTRIQTGPDRPAARGQSTPEQTRTGQPGEGSEVARLVAQSFPNRSRTVPRSGSSTPPPGRSPAPRRHDQGPKRGRGR